MDLRALRLALRPLVMSLSIHTHTELERICGDYDLPPPGDPSLSKSKRMAAANDAIPDEQLALVAQRFLEHGNLHARSRNQLQDILWADSGAPPINKRCRREIALALEGLDHYGRAAGFDALLEQLWVLQEPETEGILSYGSPNTLRGQIKQHVHWNPEDWTAVDLFENLGAFDASDRRFALFLEGLASEEIRPDETLQREFVGRVNPVLKSHGLELREVEGSNGYPAFVIAAFGSGGRRPKNLIFGSPLKPDLRLRDAVHNDIEIVTNADQFLVYDRSIGPEGLMWRHLQEWWAETQRISDADEAKRSLYRRLRDSLPVTSPPQQALFEGYYRTFGSAIPGLPALLPEVWLHWDPMTMKQRGPLALIHHRMDFLLLLGKGIRVVLEVDGLHHYSLQGQPSPSEYAKLARGDRELKLAGYEVFRFGGHELGDGCIAAIGAFFRSLFRRYGVDVPPPAPNNSSGR